MSYRIMISLGGKVGELNLSKRDLADLCEMRPGTAGEWVRGVFESPAFNQAARICEELEIELWDFISLAATMAAPAIQIKVRTPRLYNSFELHQIAQNKACYI